MLGTDTGKATLSFPKEEVFETTKTVATKMKGFKVKSADIGLGRIVLSSSTSATSWGEEIPIQISEIDANKTEIEIVSKSNTGIFAGGLTSKKNQQNVEILLSNVSKHLRGEDIAVRGGSPYGALAVMLFALFFGWLGLHRFYVGKWKTGLLFMFTFGCLGVGWLIDVIRIIVGNFADKNGNYITNW